MTYEPLGHLRDRIAERVEAASCWLLVAVGLALLGGSVFLVAFLAHLGWEAGGR